MKKFPVSVQPFTFREALAADYLGSIARIAEIGYKGIELGPPPEGITIAEQKSLLGRTGLHVTGFHAGFNTLDLDTKRLCDYLDEINGSKFVTVSMLFESQEDLLRKAERMNEIGEQFRSRGVTFLYHNHHWEFVKFGSEYALDILLRETDPNFVQMEPDTYWLKRGGVDPASFLKKLGNRAPLLHIKDMGAGPDFPAVDESVLDFSKLMAAMGDERFAEVGEGILDFHEIAEAAEAIGTQWLIVEQDHSRRDPFESLRISLDNLIRMGLVQTE